MMCLFILHLKANVLEYMSHLNRFSPVRVLMCQFKLEDTENDLLQTSHF